VVTLVELISLATSGRISCQFSLFRVCVLLCRKSN